MCKKEFFFKFRDEKLTIQSLGMKNELHAKFRDENNIFVLYKKLV